MTRFEKVVLALMLLQAALQVLIVLLQVATGARGMVVYRFGSVFRSDDRGWPSQSSPVFGSIRNACAPAMTNVRRIWGLAP